MPSPFEQDLAACLPDLFAAAGEEIGWDGQSITAVIDRGAGVGDMSNFDATAEESWSLLVLADNFTRPFPGSRHQIDGESWEVTAALPLAGGAAYKISVIRALA